MARRCVRLGPIDVAGFKHPFQPRNSVLLVKLRALGQKSRSLEVAYFEQIAAAFSCVRHYFGGEDLADPPPSQRGTKRLGQRRLDPKNGGAPLGPERERTIVQRQLRRDLFQTGGRGKRKDLCRRVQHLNDLSVDFKST